MEQRSVVRGRGTSTPYRGYGGDTHFVAKVVRPLGATVRVSRERRYTALTRWFRGRDVRLGEADFDGNWYIRSHDPAVAQARLGGEVRRRIGGVLPVRLMLGNRT